MPRANATIKKLKQQVQDLTTDNAQLVTSLDEQGALYNHLLKDKEIADASADAARRIQSSTIARAQIDNNDVNVLVSTVEVLARRLR